MNLLVEISKMRDVKLNLVFVIDRNNAFANFSLVGV